MAPQVWIAPGHSFDGATLDLLPAIGIDRVSDGLFFWPHTDRGGLLWVPQQIWRFRRVPFGLWTVCLHPNRWDEGDIQRFDRDIAAYARNIIGFDEVVHKRWSAPPIGVENLLLPIMRRCMRWKTGGWGRRAPGESQ